MFGEARREEARDGGALGRARRVPDVGGDGDSLAVAHQAQARVVEAVAAQYLVERVPRHERRELSPPASDVRVRPPPARVEELTRRERLQKFVQTVEGHRS